MDPSAGGGLHKTKFHSDSAFYPRIEKVTKKAELVLDFPDFVPYLNGLAEGRNFVDAHGYDAISSISSGWNGDGIRGKIEVEETTFVYDVKFEATLSTHHIGFCAFHFDVKAFIYGGAPNSALVASRQDSGIGKTSQCARSSMRIKRQDILEKAKGTDATTFRIVLNVKAEVYEQPTPHSIVGACANKQCDPPFLEHLDTGSSDVQITCDSETIPVHAFILKHASPVFRRMLEAPLKEAATRKILIEDLSVDTVKRMVDYIYYGRINFGSNTQVVDLLYAAEKYELELLKASCLERMVTSMSDENVTLFLEITVRVNAGDQIIKPMVTYCLQRMEKLLKREDFRAFAQANPGLFLGNKPA